MKIIALHSDFIEITPKKKAIKDADKVDKKTLKFKECLVVLSAAQAKDESNPESVAKNLSKQVEDIANRVNTKTIVLYPYVHLVSDPSNPKVAKEILNNADKLLKKKFKVNQAPFGWYKQFNIKCKGHPLSELSREFGPEAEEKEEERDKQSKIHGFEIILPNGKIVSEKQGKKYPAVECTILDECGKGGEDKKEPIHIELIKKLSISRNEPVSDSGCYSWFPNGAFMKQLIRERTWQGFVSKFGAYPVTTPLIIRRDDPGVQWLTGHFPERQYRVLPGRKDKVNEMTLKTAGDYAIFSIFRDMHISYKQLPIAFYEDEQYDHRYEQRGELRGMNRVREFEMHNVHSVCVDEKQAYNFWKSVFSQQCEILGDIGLKPDAFIFYCEKGKKKKYLPYLKELAKTYKVPVIIELLTEITVYMGAWVDYIVLDSSNRPMEICTSQVDFQTAKYWNIDFVDKKGNKKQPFIVHTGFGIERTIAALLEILARNKNPIIPLWLSPIQVRICPVSDKFLKDANKLADKLEKENIRVDVDDRTESIGKKVSGAQKEWVPFVIVYGDKEKKSKKLPIRVRETDKVENMTLEQFIKKIKKKTSNKPFLRAPFPRNISIRPTFS